MRVLRAKPRSSARAADALDFRTSLLPFGLAFFYFVWALENQAQVLTWRARFYQLSFLPYRDQPESGPESQFILRQHPIPEKPTNWDDSGPILEWPNQHPKVIPNVPTVGDRIT